MCKTTRLLVELVRTPYLVCFSRVSGTLALRSGTRVWSFLGKAFLNQVAQMPVDHVEITTQIYGIVARGGLDFKVNLEQVYGRGTSTHTFP